MGDSRLHARIVFLLLVLGPFPDAVAESGPDDTWTSRAGDFRVSFASDLQPIVINRIHNWILHVETADGEAVENGRISIDGGMPEHDHGLPTAPQVTRYLGDGDYLVEGLRFHMNGYWELNVTVEDGDTRDTAVIALKL